MSTTTTTTNRQLLHPSLSLSLARKTHPRRQPATGQNTAFLFSWTFYRKVVQFCECDSYYTVECTYIQFILSWLLYNALLAAAAAAALVFENERTRGCLKKGKLFAFSSSFHSSSTSSFVTSLNTTQKSISQSPKIQREEGKEKYVQRTSSSSSSFSLIYPSKNIHNSFEFDDSKLRMYSSLRYTL